MITSSDRQAVAANDKPKATVDAACASSVDCLSGIVAIDDANAAAWQRVRLQAFIYSGGRIRL